jgi:hypothetical protein
MATHHILSLLLVEREKLDQAIKALQGTRIEPVIVEPIPVEAQAAAPAKRKLSAAGRKAIIAGTKKRWAALKAAKEGGAAPVAAPKAAPAAPAVKSKTPPVSAADRKKMSDRMKAAWAERKKKAATKKK